METSQNSTPTKHRSAFRRALPLFLFLLAFLGGLIYVRHYGLAGKARELVAKWLPSSGVLAPESQSGTPSPAQFKKAMKVSDSRVDSLQNLLAKARQKVSVYRDSAHREHAIALAATGSIVVLRDSTRKLIDRVEALNLHQAQRYLASRLPQEPHSPVAFVVSGDTLTGLSRTHLDSVNRTFVRYDGARREIDTLQKIQVHLGRVIAHQDTALVASVVALDASKASDAEHKQQIVLTDEQLKQAQKDLARARLNLKLGGVGTVLLITLAILL